METHSPKPTTISDLDIDTLAHCASRLSTEDISNLAMSCKFLRSVAYSNSVWRPLFRKRWPEQCTSSCLLQSAGARKEYLARHNALQQFKFCDPRTQVILVAPSPHSHLMLDKSDVIIAQGSAVQLLKIDGFPVGKFHLQDLGQHNARITCTRLIPVQETSLCWSVTHNEDNILVTASCDWTIRLWWKGLSQRCFRGHNGPVSTLADNLVVDGGRKLLASGGEDGTVRLWSLSYPGKRGQQALRTTFYGHEKPIMSLSITGYNSSHLASLSKDAKLRVWDANASSSSRSSQCIGVANVNGDPISIRCHEMICYVAAGSSVVAIDFRTMRRVATVAVDQPKLYTFSILPQRSLVCTGGNERALLWDIRKKDEKLKPLAYLDGHIGIVNHIYMDTYKIVTGGPRDSDVRIWETVTGTQMNVLSCATTETGTVSGLSGMAVDGYRIVSSCFSGVVFYRDFTHSKVPLSSRGHQQLNKFWELQSNFDEVNCENF